jgi:hypothetical protein
VRRTSSSGRSPGAGVLPGAARGCGGEGRLPQTTTPIERRRNKVSRHWFTIHGWPMGIIQSYTQPYRHRQRQEGPTGSRRPRVIGRRSQRLVREPIRAFVGFIIAIAIDIIPSPFFLVQQRRRRRADSPSMIPQLLPPPPPLRAFTPTLRRELEHRRRRGPAQVVDRLHHLVRADDGPAVVRSLARRAPVRSQGCQSRVSDWLHILHGPYWLSSVINCCFNCKIT